MNDECVFLDGDFAIVKSYRIFGFGFNCYKAKTEGSSDFEKINNPLSFFTSFERAKEFLDSYRASPNS